MITLTKDNAVATKTIRNIDNPQWGIKRFNYRSEELNDGRYASSYGTGPSSAVLFESEYKFWEVIS